jgi:alpha-L-rhamnosidase
VIAELPVERTATGPSCVLLDAGQNVAGFVRLSVRGDRGTVVTVRHAEVLEPDGSLHTLSLRSARATDTYVLADDRPTLLEPAFTFHGFRYAEVETDAEILDATVVAISSDTPRRSTFSCSDDRLVRLHENVVWSQRGNFVSVPTDCPQRDERLGWTGDAQAFAPTASTLFESETFWSSWLCDLDLDQDDELGVPSVVPDVVIGGVMRYGRAGWADAATIVPWAVHESFGDPQVLRDQLDSMRRWVRSLDHRRGEDGLLTPSPQFGDWLDPDAPSDRPWDAKASGEFLANAYFAHSARLLADAEALVGEPAGAERAGRLADQVAASTWSRWRDHALTTQTGCAVAVRLGIAPHDERAAVAAVLARLVREADGRVATGFLGTPLVLPALSDFGHFDEAYSMLLRREAPSWLYQVDQGATTVWERWDAIRPDGSIHDGRMAPNPIDPSGREGQMLSFNHYAYGAVVDWMYRHLAGIAPDRDRPGYRHIRFAPRPVDRIDRASASIETAYGLAAVAWRIEGPNLTVEMEVPVGTTATLDPPVSDRSSISLDGHPLGGPSIVPIDVGRHTATITDPRLAKGRS